MKVDGVDSIGMNYALISEKEAAIGTEKHEQDVQFDTKSGMLAMPDGSIPVLEDNNAVAYVNFSV